MGFLYNRNIIRENLLLIKKNPDNINCIYTEYDNLDYLYSYLCAMCKNGEKIQLTVGTKGYIDNRNNVDEFAKDMGVGADFMSHFTKLHPGFCLNKRNYRNVSYLSEDNGRTYEIRIYFNDGRSQCVRTVMKCDLKKTLKDIEKTIREGRESEPGSD